MRIANPLWQERKYVDKVKRGQCLVMKKDEGKLFFHFDAGKRIQTKKKRGGGGPKTNIIFLGI